MPVAIETFMLSQQPKQLTLRCQSTSEICHIPLWVYNFKRALVTVSPPSDQSPSRGARPQYHHNVLRKLLSISKILNKLHCSIVTSNMLMVMSLEVTVISHVLMQISHACCLHTVKPPINAPWAETFNMVSQRAFPPFRSFLQNENRTIIKKVMA